MRTFATILASLSVMRFTEEQMVTILREADERSMPAVGCNVRHGHAGAPATTR
jgi:hypothetical protein